VEEMLRIIGPGLVRSSPVAWVGLLTALASVYLVARVATYLGMYVASRPWRRYERDQWTERARLAWPCRLGHGWVEEGEVVCPLHLWRFRLADGRCMTIPGERVHRFRCEVRRDLVWVEV
jgi:hypothetical protein